MPKRLKTQRRGKGSPKYKARGGTKKITYITPDSVIEGEIKDIVHNRGRGAPLVEILTENGSVFYTVAAEGEYTGKRIKIFPAEENKEVKDIPIGSIAPLSVIPAGWPIFNIETQPGNGGKLVRSSGNYALILGKDDKKAYVKLPSGKQRVFDLRCRATIGIVAGGGRTSAPLVKAGNAYYKYKAKGGHVWPRTRGVAMNPIDHPHGGSQHHVGRSKSVARSTPPGRKVGAIASRRTGRKKGKSARKS